MIFFCYELDYDGPSDDSGISPVLYHVRMFALAEKYKAYGLGLLAVDKFRKAASMESTVEKDLVGAIREAYETRDEEGLLGRVILDLVGQQWVDERVFGEAIEVEEVEGF
ncbi:hypothetical protein CLAFUW4_12499 [Fulvia fulva]|uniref:Uncharacterized protein n=1 Tax=Passalora fulva TaxID=5499 RepID=A0A9Q8PEL9_PASFU|nr:uncharacterized protein CLAFUR5_11525 [Fulvia fulva]KAK4618248.1 hypothetical protein CLAFUR4_12504 [Fulvia fulva]KAK4618447.1 hypothetical protein CLAFUR0_12515 [Fulvia fulva]UJO21020.1 hypothetical protein CLAFUR5_11525 [Fulvia fulva]WPV18275.1 hypothetical protein CLAFUW4_12499 [Fulvia fulva]WPV33227.1 hypothetical protein CLAFUW7_12506 [Fulvia fulva]